MNRNLIIYEWLNWIIAEYGHLLFIAFAHLSLIFVVLLFIRSGRRASRPPAAFTVLILPSPGSCEPPVLSTPPPVLRA